MERSASGYGPYCTPKPMLQHKPCCKSTENWFRLCDLLTCGGVGWGGDLYLDHASLSRCTGVDFGATPLAPWVAPCVPPTNQGLTFVDYREVDSDLHLHDLWNQYLPPRAVIRGLSRHLRGKLGVVRERKRQLGRRKDGSSDSSKPVRVRIHNAFGHALEGVQVRRKREGRGLGASSPYQRRAEERERGGREGTHCPAELFISSNQILPRVALTAKTLSKFSTHTYLSLVFVGFVSLCPLLNLSSLNHKCGLHCLCRAATPAAHCGALCETTGGSGD